MFDICGGREVVHLLDSGIFGCSLGTLFALLDNDNDLVVGVSRSDGLLYSALDFYGKRVARLAEDKRHNDLLPLNLGTLKNARRYNILLQFGMKNPFEQLFYAISHNFQLLAISHWLFLLQI